MDTFSPCWMLNERFQGKGYAYEAARAYFDYLFNVKNIRRIYAYAEDYNLSSQRLCEKLGMRREGLFKEFVSFVNAGFEQWHFQLIEQIESACGEVDFALLEKIENNEVWIEG